MNGLASRLMILRGLAGGISLRDFADLADVAPSYPGHIERSQKDVDISSQIAMRMAQVFGCSLPYLLTGEGGPPPENEVRAAVEKAREDLAARNVEKAAKLAAAEPPKATGTHGAGQSGTGPEAA